MKIDKAVKVNALSCLANVVSGNMFVSNSFILFLSKTLPPHSCRCAKLIDGDSLKSFVDVLRTFDEKTISAIVEDPLLKSCLDVIAAASFAPSPSLILGVCFLSFYWNVIHFLNRKLI